MPTVSVVRSLVRRSCAASVVVASLAACSLLTPDEAVQATEDQWGSLPRDVREALGVGAEDSYPVGAVAEHWVIEAPVDLQIPEPEDVLGGRITAGCQALVESLAGTGTQAFGQLPLTDGLVLATEETCTRGLGLGSWDLSRPPVEDSAGRSLELGQLELGQARGDRADLLGIPVHLDGLTVRTSDETPPWQAPLTAVSAASFDQALADASTALPLDLPAPGGTGTTFVFRTPAGTVLDAVALCGKEERVDSISVESSDEEVTSTIWASGAELPPGEVDGAHVNCGGLPASATLTPTLRYTPGGGGPTDITVLDVVSIDPAGTDPVRVTARRAS